MDTLIYSKDETIILDTKYYKEYLSTNYDKKTLISANMYQMLAYLNNINATNNTVNNFFMNYLDFFLIVMEKDKRSLAKAIKKANIILTTIEMQIYLTIKTEYKDK